MSLSLTGTAPLTAMERSALTHAEATIERGLQSWQEVGSALREVSERRLYREDFATFEDYCAGRWNLSRKRGYDLISAAGVMEGLSPMGDIPLPANERQTRELSGLDPEDAAAVLAAADEMTDGSLTAAAIAAARARLHPEPPAPVDDLGKVPAGAGHQPQADGSPEPRPPASPTDALAEYLDGDQGLVDAKYMHAFLGHLARFQMGTWDAERLAELADPTEAGVIAMSLGQVTEWHAKFTAAQASGLRLLKGGAQ